MVDVRQVRAGDLFSERYRVERLLKAGGMGAVYVAEHVATRRKIALKLMHPEIVADAEARARFAQEAQVAALIESANIVDVYDAGVDAQTGIPFIAMELLVGTELADLLTDTGRLDPRSVVDYVGQVARGLDRAHAAGIVHRDLKPENLFLVVRSDEPPRVKILDFGIAKLTLAATPTTTRASGTPLYMAPEQAKRGAPVGAYTDIWALGLITYTLLVGRSYWLAADLHSLYGEIFAGQFEPPSVRARAVGVTLSPAFDAWFLRCVNVDPGRRFPRASAAAHELAAVFGLTVPSTGDHQAPTLAEDETEQGEPLVFDPARMGTTPPLAALSTHDESPTQAPARTATTPSAQASPPPVSAPVPTTSRPVTPDPPVSATRIVVGALLGVALSGGGYVAYQHFRRPAAASAKPAAAKPAVASVAVGLSDVTCIVSDRGTVSCRGTAFVGEGRQAGEEVDALGTVTSLAVGKHHACAVRADKTIACWGDNNVGQLGDGTTNAHGPAAVVGLTGVTALASSIHGSCALLSTGKLACWGGNKYGQVGDGTFLDRLTPVEIPSLSGVTTVRLGQDHGCALLKDASVRCWGKNDDRELGNEGPAKQNTPAEVQGLSDVAGLALGGHFSCALMKDGTVRCWGANGDGELGDGTTTTRPTPAPVQGLTGVAAIATGSTHACAVDTAGSVRCWGANTFGQLGDGTTTSRNVPVLVAGTFTTHLDAGRGHTCALRTDGVVACWGRNTEGQLGDGTEKNRLEPVAYQF